MTWFFWLICSLPGLVYLCWVGALYFGFKRQLNRGTIPWAEEQAVFTTIIVPARNEEQTIGLLLEALNRQTLSQKLFEIIVVDDHSEDRTAQVVADFAAAHPTLNLLRIAADDDSDNPKKKAIAAAVAIGKGDLLITVDADCTMEPHWLERLVAAFQDPSVALVAGPVRMKPVSGVFACMQALEFLSLVGSGMAMAGWGEPVMANGANLAFTRRAYQQLKAATRLSSRVSGDDVELLMAMKRQDRGSIRFLNDPSGFVNTRPQHHLSEFFQQRIRWASKAKSAYDPWNTLMALWVFLYHLLLITLPVVGLFRHEFLWAALFLFVMKLLGDYPFLWAVTHFSDQKKLLRVYLPLQFIYPWYILFTALAGLFGTYIWKGRTFKGQ